MDFGHLLRIQGNLDGALACYDEAVRLDPQVDIYNNRGTARAYKGDYLGAIADFNQALAINPGNLPAYKNRGATYAEVGS